MTITAEYSDGRNLSDDEIAAIKLLMDKITEAAALVREPIDPKVEGMLELTFGMLSEQLESDKKFEWEEPASREDKFFHDKNVPSVDELKSWFLPSIDENK